MKNQVGARYLARERAKLQDKPVVCTQHYKAQEESEVVRLKSGAVRRKRGNL
jgi:hypothetical protein